MPSWAAALLGAFLKSIADGINSYLAAQQARADEQTLGQRNQQLSDNRALIAAANAQTQAVISAPKTVQAVEGALDAGKF